MILPQTHAVALALMFGALLCWGLWPNTLKAAGKWRYELFYFDFSLGVALAALLIVFTAGNLGFDGFSLVDDLMHAGKHQWLFALAAGVLLNAENMLLTAAIPVGGMAVAFPVSAAAALTSAVLLSQLSAPSGSPALIAGACAAALVALALAIVSHRINESAKREALARAGKTKDTRRRVSMRAVYLALAGGVVGGPFLPLVRRAEAGDLGLGPYAVLLLVAAGVAISTLVLNLFLMNLPVDGQPLEIRDYFRGRAKAHLYGILGGLIWCAGTAALLISSAPPAQQGLPITTSYAAAQASAIVAVLCGVLLWKERQGGDVRISVMTFFTLLLLACATLMAA